MATPFIIEEVTGQGRLKVELVEHDVPMGRPRKGGAFDLGGIAERDIIHLHGRKTPIIQTKQNQFRPTIIKGHLRDSFYGQGLGRAQSIMADIERIRDRMRRLELRWGPFRWSAFLHEAKFPIEGEGDIPYELTFDNLLGPSQQAIRRPADSRTAPADLVAQVRAQFNAYALTITLVRISAGVAARIAASFSALDHALDEAEQSAGLFDVAKQLERQSAAKGIIARIGDVKQKVADFLVEVAQLNRDVLLDPIAGQKALFSQFVHDAQSQMTAVLDGIRTAELTAARAVRQNKKLYRVGVGDTLESIAIAELGSSLRANDIGVRPEDLRPGALISLPES